MISDFADIAAYYDESRPEWTGPTVPSVEGWVL